MEYVSDYLTENRVFVVPKPEFMQKNSKEESFKSEKGSGLSFNLGGSAEKCCDSQNKAMKRYKR